MKQIPKIVKKKKEKNRFLLIYLTFVIEVLTLFKMVSFSKLKREIDYLECKIKFFRIAKVVKKRHLPENPILQQLSTTH